MPFEKLTISLLITLFYLVSGRWYMVIVRYNLNVNNIRIDNEWGRGMWPREIKNKCEKSMAAASVSLTFHIRNNNCIKET